MRQLIFVLLTIAIVFSQMSIRNEKNLIGMSNETVIESSVEYRDDAEKYYNESIVYALELYLAISITPTLMLDDEEKLITLVDEIHELMSLRCYEYSDHEVEEYISQLENIFVENSIIIEDYYEKKDPQHFDSVLGNTTIATEKYLELLNMLDTTNQELKSETLKLFEFLTDKYTNY